MTGTNYCAYELARRIRKEFERVTEGDPLRRARMLDVAREGLPKFLHTEHLELGDEETIALWLRRAIRWDIEDLANTADALGYEVEVNLRIKVQ